MIGFFVFLFLVGFLNIVLTMHKQAIKKTNLQKNQKN